MTLSGGEIASIAGFTGITILTLLSWALRRIWDRLQKKVDRNEERITIVERTVVTRDYLDQKMETMTDSIQEQHRALSNQLVELDKRVFNLATGKKQPRR